MASSHTNATRSRPVGGCIPSNKQSQQQNFGSFRKYSDKQLPSCVDLRALMTPVEDQGQTNSWLGFSFFKVDITLFHTALII